MRGRLYNNEFFMAGYSFSFLSKYYGHVVSRLDDAADIIKESGRERDQAHREKGLQYDRKGQENFEKIYAEIWPGYFHNSFLITACSFFEHQMKKLWAIIQEENEVPLTWDDFSYPVHVRMKKRLRFADVTIKDNPPVGFALQPPELQALLLDHKDRVETRVVWKELRFYYRVRNCIIHDNGIVDKAQGSTTLREYASKKGILIDRDGQSEIQLNREFNRTVCEIMEIFCEKLLSAYYSST